MDIKDLLSKFMEEVNKNDSDIEIYNETSLQFELGKFLKAALECKGYKVDFERNTVDFTTVSKSNLVKHEMDIVIYPKSVNIENIKNSDEKYVIELKMSAENGGNTETVWGMLKDTQFVEQMVEICKFTKGYCLALVRSDYNYKYYCEPVGGKKYSEHVLDLKGKKWIAGKNYVKHKKSKKGKCPPIILNNSYEITWVPEHQNTGKNKFNYYVIEI